VKLDERAIARSRMVGRLHLRDAIRGTPRTGEIDSERHIRVLVVDDHDLFRTGLRLLLEEVGFEVADAHSGAAAVRRSLSFAPDVVVMDMSMPGMTGIEATPLVLQAAPHTSVLMLTIACDDARVLQAIRAGASGYLLKDADLADIVSGIRDAAAGHCAIAPGVAGALVQSVRKAELLPVDAADAGGPDLSVREQQVLALVSDGRDNADIAGRLYLSESTVKNHVSKLLAKIGVDNRVQAATFAVRNGFARVD
jgi:DNA-binding NarL/FixJ family response regulator